MAASWRDMSTPVDPSPPAAAAPSSSSSTQPAPKSGGGWRDQSTPSAPAPAPAATAPASAAPSSDDLGSTAIWNKPADASWGDYMLAHLAKALPSGAFDPHVNANEAVLLGSGLSGGLSGFIPGMRERTAQAEAETPLGNRIAIQGAGYMLGPGKLGIASKLGEGASSLLGGGKLAQWTGGVLGSAGEGALSSGVGEAGAGGSASDIAKATGVGALAGGGGGAVGGVVGRGGTLAPAQTADALHDAAETAYKPLSNVLYDASKEVHPALNPIDAQNALKDWSGYKWGDASKTSKEVQTLLDKPQLSANDIQQSQRYLKKIANNPTSDVNDALYAKYYGGKLQDVLDNATPQFGVPQNWSNPTNAPSFASERKAAGDALHAKANDLDRLDTWIKKSQVANSPADVGGQASSWLRSDEGMRYAPQGSPQYQAANTLAGTNAGPGLSAAPSAFDVRHTVHPLVSSLAGGAAMGAGSQIAEGRFDPAHLAAETLVGAGLGYGLHRSVPAIQRAISQPGQQRAVDAYRSTLSTGQLQKPVLPDAAFRNAVRQLIFGQGAGGQF